MTLLDLIGALDQTRSRPLPRQPPRRVRESSMNGSHTHSSFDFEQTGLNEKAPTCGAFCRALFRTRTGDPLLTMEVLYQLS